MPRTIAHTVVALIFLFSLAPYLHAGSIDYNRDVRPILSSKCFQCHGPDADQRSTELRFDEQSTVFAKLESGVRAIVSGDVGQSEVYRRISSSDADIVMPPPDSGKTLTASEVQTIKQWIEEGASWGLHWSFIKPTRPTLPSLSNRDWPRDAVDYFVMSRLEQQGWAPSARADKRTLIRRATLSLTGLLPTIGEIDTFVADDSPQAYQKLVDRLLQSPRYGEHVARYWLDVARYGDTHGLHLDNERSIWRYRDWVIDAFNRNQPFDRFTIDQLAGDLLPNATLEQRIATGFHRCNVTTSEGGAIAAEFLARYAVDRVETTSTVWLGLTTGCAACHDHKFDPISQKEFYQLFAYFYNLTERAMDGNALLPPPAIKAPTYVQQLRHRHLQSELSVVQRKLQARRNLARSQQKTWEPTLVASLAGQSPPTDSIIHCSLDSPTSHTINVDGAIGQLRGTAEWVAGKVDGAVALVGHGHLDLGNVAGFERSDRFSFGGWVNIHSKDHMAVLSKMHDDGGFRGYDLYIGGGKIYVHLIHRWESDAIRVNSKLPIRKEKWHHVFATYDGSGQAAGVNIFIDGKEAELEISHDQLRGTIRTEEPLRIGTRGAGARFKGLLDDIRIYARTLGADEVGRLAASNPLADILKTPVADRTEAQTLQLVESYLQQHDDETKKWLPRQQKLRKSIARLENDFPSTLVMQDRDQPRDTFVLIRGQYDQPGDKVQPGVPAVLPPVSQPHDKTRLALARWLVHPDHPLTARVTVNRIWQQHFGIGLVKTAEDFGAQGDWPSHPMLLDYLATRLMESGWDIKALHRLIVSSSTFQQVSRLSPESLTQDPENRRLARGPRFRLEAETIRDLAIAVSGLWVGELGGPGVRPYQPMGLWEAVGYPTSTTARFRRDRGAKLYRRAIYTFWKRTSPPPSMQILDAPSREVCSVRRPRTNTPGAALLLMNDTQFVEAARKFAERILLEGGDSSQDRFQFAYEAALARLPSPEELDVMENMLTDYQAVYTAQGKLARQLLSHGDAPVHAHLDAPELAAWTMIASTILNLDETINQH